MTENNIIKLCYFCDYPYEVSANNIIDVIKEAAIRETVEETNIKLDFIDDTICSLNLYNNIIMGNYKAIIGTNKHYINIALSSNNYALLKNCFNDNFEKHKTFMENTGEISGLLL